MVFNLGINLSREEIQIMTNYLDKDGDQKVSPQEFVEKMHFQEYQLRSHKYTISSRQFYEQVLNLWYVIKAEIVENIRRKIRDKARSTFDFDEFVNAI